MSRAYEEYLDRFELFGENLESPSKKRTKSPPVKRKRDNKSQKRTKTPTKHYDNNDTEFKQMLENIEDPGLPDEYDTFNAEMEQLYKTLERNDDAKELTELTEIIKELTERINEKIKTENENIQKSTNQFHIQYRKNDIIRYKNNLIKLNNLNNEQKADILEIYNNRYIHKDDKRNAINAIINGDKVMDARIRDINDKAAEINSIPINMANSVYKSTSPTSKKKRKRGGKKSKSKKYIKSK